MRACMPKIEFSENACMTKNFCLEVVELVSVIPLASDTIRSFKRSPPWSESLRTSRMAVMFPEHPCTKKASDSSGNLDDFIK